MCHMVELALELILCDRMVLLIDVWYSTQHPPFLLSFTESLLGMHLFSESNTLHSRRFLSSLWKGMASLCK